MRQGEREQVLAILTESCNRLIDLQVLVLEIVKRVSRLRQAVKDMPVEEESSKSNKEGTDS